MSLGFEASKATHVWFWVLEAGNNERSCQGELRKRHSGAGQKGVGQGAKLKVVHKSVL